MRNLTAIQDALARKDGRSFLEECMEDENANRHLVGYGVPALLQVLDGMGHMLSSLNDVEAVYLRNEDYDRYILQDRWHEFCLGAQDLEENGVTIAYMLAKGLLRRGMPEQLVEHQNAWSMAVYGRQMHSM